MTAIVRTLLFSPVTEANRQKINHLALAYGAAMELAERGLELTGEIHLDGDLPELWIEPPQHPLRHFDAYAKADGNAYVSAIYHVHGSRTRRCRICWSVLHV